MAQDKILITPAHDDALDASEKLHAENDKFFHQRARVRSSAQRSAHARTMVNDFVANREIRAAALAASSSFYVPVDGDGCFHTDTDEQGVVREHGRGPRYVKSDRCAICAMRRQVKENVQNGKITWPQARQKNEEDDRKFKLWANAWTRFFANKSPQEIITILNNAPHEFLAASEQVPVKRCKARSIAQRDGEARFIAYCPTHGETEHYTSSAHCVSCVNLRMKARYSAKKYGGMPYTKTTSGEQHSRWLSAGGINPLLNTTAIVPSTLPLIFIELVRQERTRLLRDVQDNRSQFMRYYTLGFDAGTGSEPPEVEKALGGLRSQHRRLDIDTAKRHVEAGYTCPDTTWHKNIITPTGTCGVCDTIMRQTTNRVYSEHPPITRTDAEQCGLPACYDGAYHVLKNKKGYEYFVALHSHAATRPLLSIRYREDLKPMYDDMTFKGYHPYNNPAIRHNQEQLFIETEACLMGEHAPLALLWTRNLPLVTSSGGVTLKAAQSPSFVLGKDAPGYDYVYAPVCVGCNVGNGAYEDMLHEYGKLVRFGTRYKARFFNRTSAAQAEQFMHELRALDLLLHRAGHGSIIPEVSPQVNPDGHTYMDTREAFVRMSAEDRIVTNNFMNMLRVLLGAPVRRTVFVKRGDVIREIPYVDNHGVPGAEFSEEICLNQPAPLLNGKIEISTVDYALFKKAGKLFSPRTKLGATIQEVGEHTSIPAPRWLIEHDVKVAPDEMLTPPNFELWAKQPDTVAEQLDKVKMTTLTGMKLNMLAHNIKGQLMANGTIISENMLDFHVNRVVQSAAWALGFDKFNNADALVTMLIHAQKERING